MARLTLGTTKATIARVIGCSTSSSMVTQYLNEAQARLMTRGNWKGTIVRYRVCMADGNLTWPRQIETILKANLCNCNVMIANQWYEFSPVGPGGFQDDDNPGLLLEDLGQMPTFSTITGTNKKLTLSSTSAADSGERMLVQGYNDSNQWIRTYDSTDAAWVDGEYLTIGGTSNSVYASVTGIIKPESVGTWTLSEYDTVYLTTNSIGIYEWDETHPIYRRSRIPSLSDYSDCSDDGCEDGYKKITVLAKLRHMPVARDNDWLILESISALKLMVMAILKEEKDLWQEAAIYEAKAIKELEKELVDYDGGATVPRWDFQCPSVYGAGSIEGVV